MASAKNAAGRLDTYRSMRDFTRTPEPAGDQVAVAPGGPGTFVVQRHRARRLHYDLRLEMDGVLASWAVPKGPTLDPAARRLAVHVEDHPIEYADFEGVIGHGEYGGGDVVVWDRGTWSLVRGDDPVAEVASGELHFDLDGQKLKGRFLLIRRDKDRSGKEQWLLLHKNDEYAVPGWDTEGHPESVKTGRTNDEVAADPDARWDGSAPAAEAEVPLRRRTPPPVAKPTRRELSALAAIGAKGTWALDGRELALTNLDKVLFPGRDGEEPITKRELIRYHAEIAPVMLPALFDRPVNLNRFPNGVDKGGFWHKAVPTHAPEWLARWRYDDARRGETEWYFVIDSAAALAWMANYGAVELHPWTSTVYDATGRRGPTSTSTRNEVSFDDVLVLARCTGPLSTTSVSSGGRR
jgi:bifunctional non-homologous end joining protein LigD